MKRILIPAAIVAAQDLAALRANEVVAGYTCGKVWPSPAGDVVDYFGDTAPVEALCVINANGSYELSPPEGFAFAHHFSGWEPLTDD